MSGHDRPDGGPENLDQTRWDEAAAALPREIAPERDLWPRIAARISEESGPSANRRWRLAGALAAAVALVAFSSLATLWISGDDRDPELSHVVPPGGAVPSMMAFGPDHELGPKYRLARNALTMDLEVRLQALPPATREIVERNLGQIRGAVAEINAALAEDPDNALLQQLLMATYQDELDVLTEVNRMATSMPTRTEI
ncbi:MAG: hypothetical protein PVG91_10445 [Gammaproteobacteria bacterium]|jgi:hypothetical protein